MARGDRPGTLETRTRGERQTRSAWNQVCRTRSRRGEGAVMPITLIKDVKMFQTRTTLKKLDRRSRIIT